MTILCSVNVTKRLPCQYCGLEMVTFYFLPFCCPLHSCTEVFSNSGMPALDICGVFFSLLKHSCKLYLATCNYWISEENTTVCSTILAMGTTDAI